MFINPNSCLYGCQNVSENGTRLRTNSKPTKYIFVDVAKIEHQYHSSELTYHHIFKTENDLMYCIQARYSTFNSGPIMLGLLAV